MTAVDELAVYDVVDGVGAPVPRILCAAARPRSAAPFVGEQHLRPVIVERRRVPIGEAFVDHRVDPLRLARVGDVEDDAVARTRARGEIAGRKDGDVVALVGPARLLGVLAMVPAFPHAREAPGLAVREYGGDVDDARLRRVGERNVDDLDAETR